MLTAETAHAEGSRYAAPLVCVPALWAGPEVWRGFASYLGHRGWESHLLDVRGVAGGIAARAAAVAEYAEALATAPILVGHDGGALVALAAAQRVRSPALVLLAPLAPGTRPVRRLILAPRAILALVVGRPVPPPPGATWSGPPNVQTSLAEEDAASVRDVVWNRVDLSAASGVPTALFAGTADPLLECASAETLAQTVGAELHVLPDVGHWPLVGPRWQQTVAVVHRWLVRTLGAPLLELYPEAMAERDADETDGEDG